MAEDLGADLGEEQLGQRAGGDARRGLPGAGPLEHVAGVVEAVLLHADEVGVAGAGLVEGLLGGARRGRHLLLPLRPLGVVDDDRDRRAEGEAVADAAEELDVVALEAHAGATAEPEAAAGELVADLLDGDGQARGQPLDHHREGGAVGLTGGQVTQHADDLSIRLRKGTVQDTGALSGRSAHSSLGSLAGRVSCPCTSRGSGRRRGRGDGAGGEERAERDGLALPAELGGDEDDADHRAVEEPEEQAEHHLAPAEHAEGEAEGERQLHVAEAHAARRDEVEHEEDRERDDAGDEPAHVGVEVAVGRRCRARAAPASRR